MEVDPHDYIYSQPEIASQSTPPIVPQPELYFLSKEERAFAIGEIIAAGEEGKDIGDTGIKFIWKEKCGVGFGQKERVSDQMHLKVGRHCRPICTHIGPQCEDCFSTTGTRTSEMEPKCFMHKGPNVGYSVYEFKKKEAEVTEIGHMIISYNYASNKKIDHLTEAFSSRLKPKGTAGQPELFDNCDDAEKRFAVLQTVSMLKCLSDPTKFKYITPSVSLANGLEAEVQAEMEKQRFTLQITGINNSKSANAKIPFPFGRRAAPGEKLTDLLDDDNGALYIKCDEKMFYGGQTVSGKDSHDIVRNPTDTVAQYENEYGTGNLVKIPLCAIPISNKVKTKTEDKATSSTRKKEEDPLKKVEAHLQICLYIAYLFRLRNPFHPTFAKTHPYCLNKEVISSYIDDNSWEKIVLFLKREFGCKFEFIKL